MHRCSYSRERASEAFSKRGSKQQLLTLTQTHRQPPVQGWRRRSGWALRAIEKTDASVPAHEDERAARGRETFPYATFHEDIRKNVAILLLLAQYCVGLRPAALVKRTFSYVVIGSIYNKKWPEEKVCCGLQLTQAAQVGFPAAQLYYKHRISWRS